MNGMYEGECLYCGEKVYFYKTSKSGPDPDVFCDSKCERNYKFEKRRFFDNARFNK